MHVQLVTTLQLDSLVTLLAISLGTGVCCFLCGRLAVFSRSCRCSQIVRSGRARVDTCGMRARSNLHISELTRNRSALLAGFTLCGGTSAKRLLLGTSCCLFTFDWIYVYAPCRACSSSIHSVTSEVTTWVVVPVSRPGTIHSDVPNMYGL